MVISRHVGSTHNKTFIIDMHAFCIDDESSVVGGAPGHLWPWQHAYPRAVLEYLSSR
jgi:hypothetical protein